MKAKEAVAQRILQLCEERELTVNMLATESGVPPSSVYSMLNQKSKNPGVVSLKKLCDGLGITLRFFFDSDLFDDLEQEIQLLSTPYKEQAQQTVLLCLFVIGARVAVIRFSETKAGLVVMLMKVTKRKL